MENISLLTIENDHSCADSEELYKAKANLLKSNANSNFSIDESKKYKDHKQTNIKSNKKSTNSKIIRNKCLTNLNDEDSDLLNEEYDTSVYLKSIYDTSLLNSTINTFENINNVDFSDSSDNTNKAKILLEQHRKKYESTKVKKVKSERENDFFIRMLILLTSFIYLVIFYTIWLKK